MKVLRGGSSSLESPVMKIEAKSLVRRPSGRGGWVSVNVEDLLSKWFENPKDNHGVVLHAVDDHDRQIVVTDHAEEDGALVSVWQAGDRQTRENCLWARSNSMGDLSRWLKHVRC